VTYASTVLADGAVAHYRLGESSGTAAVDAINGNDGTYQNTPTLGVTGALAGDANTAVTFASASSEYVNRADAAALDLGDVFTIELWAKRASTGQMVLVQKGTGTDSGYQVWINTSHEVRLSDGAGNVVSFHGAVWSDTTDWHHVVFTKNGSTRDAYFDGVEDTGLATNRTLTDNASDLSIASGNGGVNYFDGTLDEVALYDVALTATQVLDHYARGKSRNEYERQVFLDLPTFVAPMDESSGNLTDLVRGKTVTANGSPTYSVTGPVTGKTAIDFDASGDYFTVADHVDLDLGDGPFTIELWYARDEDLGTYQSVLNKGDNAYAINGANPADHYSFGKRNVAEIIRSDDTVLTDGLWHHIVITKLNGFGTGKAHIFVDGTDDTVELDTTSNTVLNDTTDVLEIGRETASFRAGGKIAYVALYKSVLSGTRVLAHYDARHVWTPDNAYETEIATDDPVFVASMEESSGNITDIVHGKTGTANGSPTYSVTGPISGKTAIDFASSGADYFSFADHDDLDLGDNPFTIEVWYARDDDTGANQMLLQKGTNSPAMNVQATDKMQIGKAGVEGIITTAGTVATDGSWHHYAWVRTGTGQSGNPIYVDGVAVSLEDSDAPTSTLASTTAALILGTEGSSGAGGKLAYVAFYKTALSGTRVLAHYDAGNGGGTDALTSRHIRVA
jgi:hypothetical protein